MATERVPFAVNDPAIVAAFNDSNILLNNTFSALDRGVVVQPSMQEEIPTQVVSFSAKRPMISEVIRIFKASGSLWVPGESTPPIGSVLDINMTEEEVPLDMPDDLTFRTALKWRIDVHASNVIRLVSSTSTERIKHSLVEDRSNGFKRKSGKEEELISVQAESAEHVIDFIELATTALANNAKVFKR